MATLSQLVVKLTTNSAEFDRGFSNATRTVGTFGRATMDMNRGLNTVHRGLEGLALRAAGIEGPLGTVTKGMLAFSGFAGPIALVAGALGGVALAYKAIAENAQRAATEHEDFMRSLNPEGFFPRGQSPLGISQARQREFEHRGRAPFLVTNSGDIMGGILADGEEGAVPPMPHLRGLNLDQVMRLVGGSRGHLEELERTMRMPGISVSAPMGFSAQDTARFGGIRTRTAGEMGRLAETASASTKAADALGVLTGGINLLGAISGKAGTQFGQFLGGVGGLLGGVKDLNPLVGLGVGLAGAVFDFVGGGGSKPIEVHDASLSEQLRQQQDRRPDYVSVNVNLGDIPLGQFIVDSKEADRSDRKLRVPRGRYS